MKEGCQTRPWASNFALDPLSTFRGAGESEAIRLKIKRATFPVITTATVLAGCPISTLLLDHPVIFLKLHTVRHTFAPVIWQLRTVGLADNLDPEIKRTTLIVVEPITCFFQIRPSIKEVSANEEQRKAKAAGSLHIILNTDRRFPGMHIRFRGQRYLTIKQSES